MTLVADVRKRLYAGELAGHAAAYEEAPDPGARAAHQLEALNAVWRTAARDCLYWARVREERALPERFGSLGEFAERVPAVPRQEVQEHVDAMSSRARGGDFQRMTGGSTSEPVQLPAWQDEVTHTRWNHWVGRGWYGIDPSARLFLLWGHSHLLGTGWAGWLRARRLELSDRLLGYHRFSAYDLRPEVLRRAAEELVAFRPAYVVGYAVALDLLARANADRPELLRRAGVRVVIGTAEAFPDAGSAERITELFGCPVAMEYGAVETAVMAHTHPEGGYRVFWRDFLLEAVGEGKRRRILVTALHPRCFPLIRYEIGDELELADAADPGVGVERFERVAGRCNEYVELADGSRIHSEAFSHAVRACPPIRGFQVVVSPGALRLSITAERELEAEEEAGVRERLARVHDDLASVDIERVSRLEQTVAGKTRMVVRA